MVEELARALEVGDDAVNERGDQSHVARLPTEHVVCLLTEGDGLARQLVDGDDSWLVYDDAATAHGDDDRGRADVNRHRVRDEVAQTLKRHQRARLPHE